MLLFKEYTFYFNPFQWIQLLLGHFILYFILVCLFCLLWWLACLQLFLFVPFFSQYIVYQLLLNTNSFVCFLEFCIKSMNICFHLDCIPFLLLEKCQILLILLFCADHHSLKLYSQTPIFFLYFLVYITISFKGLKLIKLMLGLFYFALDSLYFFPGFATDISELLELLLALPIECCCHFGLFLKILSGLVVLLLVMNLALTLLELVMEFCDLYSALLYLSSESLPFLLFSLSLQLILFNSPKFLQAFSHLLLNLS